MIQFLLLRVGQGAQVYVCKDGLYLGQCETISEDAPRLSNNTIGNDKISSAKVQRLGSPNSRCAPDRGEATFFQHADYKGICAVRRIGDYPHSVNTGLNNDSISSVKVGEGTRLQVCRNANYGGVCEIFTEDDPKLSNNRIGNDEISSAKIQSR